MGQSFSVHDHFLHRVERIPRLGWGLSVDVYSPDLFELIRSFNGENGRPSYLEVFRATSRALKAVRAYDTSLPLAYHGEGIWITEPGFTSASFFQDEITEVACHLGILQSPWFTHECATKQMVGYSFGTYLPPLYTAESAEIIADNIRTVQERMDQAVPAGQKYGPLFLLELPPLTYFMAGTISVPEFFRRITDRVACGLVLDIGHLWTVFRYSGVMQSMSLEDFVERFLGEFPMQRVVEIHCAGLASHSSSVPGLHDSGMPDWLDAHAAPIPSLALSMLEHVLAHPCLINLRGVALEVDTKPIHSIVREFREVSRRFGTMVEQVMTNASDSKGILHEHEVFPSSTWQHKLEVRQRLEESYVRYAQVVSGQIEPTGAEWMLVREDPAGLERYLREYLPHEILHWGGALEDMFPQTCRALSKCGVALHDFVAWWFRSPRPMDRPYDFFLLKIDRFLEFVTACAPDLLCDAEREAHLLRSGYANANDEVHPMMESAR